MITGGSGYNCRKRFESTFLGIARGWTLRCRRRRRVGASTWSICVGKQQRRQGVGIRLRLKKTGESRLFFPFPISFFLNLLQYRPCLGTTCCRPLLSKVFWNTKRESRVIMHFQGKEKLLTLNTFLHQQANWVFLPRLIVEKPWETRYRSRAPWQSLQWSNLIKVIK